MTAYRFRVKYDPDPTSLWRDVVVGANRTIAHFQSVINQAVGLDEGHLWFVGTDEDYWNSDIKYQSPQEYEEHVRTGPLLTDEHTYDAGNTTVGEMVGQLGLDQYDRICYLYDYGEEWRFYAILKEVLDDEPCDTAPAVVNEKGDDLDQHASPAADDVAPADSALPEPLDSFPDTAIPIRDLRALEDRDDVAHVIVLLSIETGFGAVSERFMIQYDDAGYLLENYPHGWEVIERIDREDKSEDELLEELVALARDYHAGIAEMTGAISGQQFDEETVEAMDVELDAELERKGYDHL
jgi:hypothetical protein